MQLFQEACKEVSTNRLCRSAFRSTGIYLYNSEAVLKNLPELKPDENRISNSELISAMSSTATTSPLQLVLPAQLPRHHLQIER